MKHASRAGYDLMQVAWVRRLVMTRWFPYLPQALLLGLFVGLAWLGWGQRAPEGVASKLYAKANLVNLLIWGLWWPAMVWVAVWLGRVWCAVCPLELVSNFGERLARRLGVPQRRLQSWIAAGWLIALFYLVIQLCVAGIELHRVPWLTSIFLWVLLGLALLTGLFLKDRAFCRGFCPVGLLLNVYGQGGMLAVRPRAEDPCRQCAGRDCKVAAQRYVTDARSCPSLLDPSKLDTNSECLLCAQCLKACQPRNLALLLRRPWTSRDRRASLATWPITVFVMLVSGFVTYEMCSEWKAAQALFLEPVKHTTAWLGLSPGLSGWLKGAYVLLLVPMLLWVVAGGMMRCLGGASSIGEAWRRLALPMAVVIAGGHMAKGLAKMVSWGGYLPGAIREPLGEVTSQNLAAQALPEPGLLLSMPTVSLVAVSLLALAVATAAREIHLADPRRTWARALPVALLGGLYLFLAAGWG